MLELTWGGKEPITLNDGSTRTFINDLDNVILRGYCETSEVKIGFGKCTGQILPAFELKK